MNRPSLTPAAPAAAIRRRVRHEVRDGLAVMAFSAAASSALAVGLLLISRLSLNPPVPACCAPPSGHAGRVVGDSTGRRPAFAPPPRHRTRLVTLATAATGGFSLATGTGN